MTDEMLAPCGIDCSKCRIRNAKSQPEIMKSVLDWFRDERNIDLAPEKVACDGCLGDRGKHWSAECGILKCSVDDHRLASCSDCSEFLCERLLRWGQAGPKYAAAVDRLKGMRKAT